MLLRVPGIGVTSAKRICVSRRVAHLDFDALKRIGVVLKRAQFFITVKGRYMNNFPLKESFLRTNLEIGAIPRLGGYTQTSLFDTPLLQEAR